MPSHGGTQAAYHMDEEGEESQLPALRGTASGGQGQAGLRFCLFWGLVLYHLVLISLPGGLFSARERLSLSRPRCLSPEQAVTMCLSSGRSLSLMTGQDLCCGSNHCVCSETKPSMSARPPTVWERSTLVPSSQCSKVPAGKGCGIGGWGDLCGG